MRTLFLLIVALFVVGASSASSANYRKHLAGPPSDFATMVIPDPMSTAAHTDTYSVAVNLSTTKSKYGYCWNTTYAMEGGNFTVAIISPWVTHISLIMTSPSGTKSKLGSGHLPTWGSFGFDGVGINSQSYELHKLLPGVYSLEACAYKKLNPGGIDAHIALRSHKNQKLMSHITTFDLQEDRTVGVRIQMYDHNSWTDRSKRPQVSTASYEASLKITMPNGHQAEIPFHDDGFHDDLEAGDGVFGANLEANQQGYYRTHVVVHGKHSNGIQFSRSADHIFPIASPELTLTGLSYLDKSDGGLVFLIAVDTLGTDQLISRSYSVRAQVWGTKSDIVDVYHPVAWVGGLIDVTVVNGTEFFELSLNPKWVHLAQVAHPFQLRQVVVTDLDTNVVISIRDEVFVQCLIHPQDPIFSGSQDVVIDEEMTMGPRPAKYMCNSTESNKSSKLILVHGYCSEPVWPLDDFTDAVEFSDPHQSRSNDKFAQLIREQCDKHDSCSIVAHSQGGLAALHLKTYYWSGLDCAQGGRPIQTVGSPFHGCSLAGFLAEVAGVFGYGCGPQYDITPEGAALWLSSIPPEARQHVYYYTTQYDPKKVFNSCVTAANLFLHAPNDGTCEAKYAQLEGANYMGEKIGWCHVGDMKYPPQCTDVERNSEMNKEAAR